MGNEPVSKSKRKLGEKLNLGFEEEKSTTGNLRTENNFKFYFLLYAVAVLPGAQLFSV